MSDMVGNEITTQLRHLGLSETEQRIFVNLIGENAKPLTAISKETNIPRTTVYRLCEQLTKKNLLTWTIEGKGAKVKLTDPNLLDILIKNKEAELQKTKDAITTIQKIIQIEHKQQHKTQVRYYHGKEGLRQLIWNTLQAEHEIFGYSTYGRMTVVGQTWYESYVEEFRYKKLVDMVITNENAINYLKPIIGTTRHQQETSNVRIIPSKIFYISGDISIYNNIYAVSFWDKGDVVGIEIENDEITKVQKSIFNMMWNIAKPLSI